MAFVISSLGKVRIFSVLTSEQSSPCLFLLSFSEQKVSALASAGTGVSALASVEQAFCLASSWNRHLCFLASVEQLH